MALATTTLAAAVAVDDKSIQVASATSLAPGRFVVIDQEVMQVGKDYVSGVVANVQRGLDGTKTAAHPITANVTHGAAADFTMPQAQSTTMYPVSRFRSVSSYTAAGALTLPSPGSDALAILNGTTILAMTLANPTKDMDGSILIVCGNGIAAHTVTYTAGFGNVGGTADVVTFGASQAQAVQFIAANGIWNLLGPLATATANVSGPAVA